MQKEMTFTELKGFLNGLSEDELRAQTNIHDWYVIEVCRRAGFGAYYFIEGKDGGEE